MGSAYLRLIPSGRHSRSDSLRAKRTEPPRFIRPQLTSSRKARLPGTLGAGVQARRGFFHARITKEVNQLSLDPRARQSQPRYGAAFEACICCSSVSRDTGLTLLGNFIRLSAWL